MPDLRTRSTTALPDGVVTFLFTDVEGSTRLYETDPTAYRAALARHDAIVEAAVAQHGGAIFQHAGDSFSAAFASAIDALRAALQAQQLLAEEAADEAGAIRARMALHTGEVELQGHEYFGLALHRCARLMSSAHGGQTVLSAVTAGLVRTALPAGVTLRDLGEHSLRDLTQPERISQLLAPGLPTEHPPLRTLSASPNNLPVQVTPFIGREHQQQAVREMLLHPASRLVTLTGPGGTGKTRLSLQVAADLLDRFPGGVYFVQLAPISDPALVPSAIAQVLDVRASSGRTVLDAVKEALLSKQLLLILDNFEQVVEAASTVAELVSVAPSLKVLVTSRAILRLYGEREYPVPPLSLPDRRAAPGPAHVVQFEAVRLFAERARAARPDFALTAENAADVVEICHRLDGLPLALELAAARIRSLTPRAMLQRMERRLPLLTGGARDLPARQRTLRDAIAWSYELLDPGEQTLFRRMGVFWGCSLEAAETVCAGEPARPGATSVALPLLEIEVLDGLESLVEKSLVRQIDGVEGLPRYLMLETIREYALEQLEASGEADATHRRHALGALRFAETAETALLGPEQGPWFARVEQAHDNLRAALRWCEEHGYAEPSYRLVVALWWFWSIHGHVGEGRERLASVLTRFSGSATSKRAELRARALLGASMLASLQSDYVVARALGEEGLEIRRALGDSAGTFAALENQGTVSWLQGDYRAARRYSEEALAIARELGDERGYAMVLNTLGNVSYELGELAVAKAHYTEAVALMPEETPIPGIILSLALVAQEQGEYEEAVHIAMRSLDRCRRVALRHIELMALATLGGFAIARGDLDGGRAYLHESIEITQELGDAGAAAQVLERFVELAAKQGQLEGALILAGAAEVLRGRAGARRSRSGQAKLDAALAPARHALSSADAEAVRRRGRGMSLDEAVAAALAITEPVVAFDEPPSVSTPTARNDGADSILSRREQEVALLIAQGMSNRQIAEQLVITEGTAANHVNHILSKLGLNNRAQVAAWVAENRL